MTYKQKCERIRDIIFRANGVFLEPRTGNLRWDSRDQFETYIKSLGCFLKENERKRQKGYITTPYVYDKVCVYVPVDLAEKILVLGDVP